jgi:hypothetical protein
MQYTALLSPGEDEPTDAGGERIVRGILSYYNVFQPALSIKLFYLKLD